MISDDDEIFDDIPFFLIYPQIHYLSTKSSSVQIKSVKVKSPVKKALYKSAAFMAATFGTWSTVSMIMRESEPVMFISNDGPRGTDTGRWETRHRPTHKPHHSVPSVRSEPTVRSEPLVLSAAQTLLFCYHNLRILTLLVAFQNPVPRFVTFQSWNPKDYSQD